MTINLTPLFEFAISLCAAFATYRLIPYLKEKWGRERVERLFKSAGIAVRAAEQMYETSGEKLDYVLKYLKERGFDVSADELRATVEAAVYEMNAAVTERVDAVGFAAEGKV